MPKIKSDLCVKYPLEPWLWRADWAEGRISSGNRSQVIQGWVIALFWNTFSTAVLFAVLNQWGKGNKMILFALIFPLVGLFILGSAIQSTLRWIKFGQSILRLLKMPGEVGGALNGAIEVAAKVKPHDGFKLRLTCEERTIEGYGKNRSIKKELIWEKETIIQKDLLADQGKRTGIPVYFQIPAELPSTKGGNPDTIWELEVRAQLPGVNYKAKFEVPVFDIRETHPASPATEDPTLTYQPAGEPELPLAKSKIHVRELADGIEVDFAPRRHPAAIGILAVVAGLCSLFLALAIARQASVNFVAGLVCLDMVLSGIFATTLFYSVRVVAAAGGITIFHRMLVPIITRHVPPHLIQAVIAKPIGRVGKETLYDLQVKVLTGQTYNAGYAIPGKHHAESLAKKLAESAGAKATAKVCVT